MLYFCILLPEGRNSRERGIVLVHAARASISLSSAVDSDLAAYGFSGHKDNSHLTGYIVLHTIMAILVPAAVLARAQGTHVHAPCCEQLEGSLVVTEKQRYRAGLHTRCRTYLVT